MFRRALWLMAALPMALAAQDTTTAKASLLAADRAAGTSATALARALAPDASLLLPGLDVMRGRAAWTSHLPALATASGGRHAWSPLHAVVSRDGTLGCTTGVLHLVAADTTQPGTGRYAACWKRERVGAWRMMALARAHAPPRALSLPDSLPGAPGSTGTVAPKGVDAAREMTEADRAFATFSADSGDPGGAFARWIAADGMMLGARAVPARGPDEARAAFPPPPYNGRFTWRPIDALTTASRDGSLGFTIGEARIAASDADVSYSKYLTLWRREGDGAYRFIFDLGSNRPAPR